MRPLRVLVVDDSAVVRQALSRILSRAGMVVTAALDPLIAMEKMRRERPDVVVLDLELPRMDGLTFLRRLAAEDPIPVVVCSGLATPQSEVAIRALEEGALEVIAKPRLDVKGFLDGSAARVVQAVRAAACARLERRVPAGSGRLAPRPPPPAAVRVAPRGHRDLIVMGASTGGPEALRHVLEAMPPDAPGIAIVQHMPGAFTAQFARRLDGTCRIEVKEAAHGDRLVPGRALVAAGDRHLVVRRSGALQYVEVVDGPPVSMHRPSVDVLFRSAVEAAGAAAVGVLLTGMGDDGARGLAELRAAGAHTIAQDEATSVVFGMPREAISRGAAEEVLPLGEIAAAILRRARAGPVHGEGRAGR